MGRSGLDRSPRGGPGGSFLPAHRRPLEFLTRPWFWLIVAGVVITAAAGAMWNSGESAWWIAPVAVGLILALSGIVLLFRPRLRFAEVADPPVIIGAAVASGLIGPAAALSIMLMVIILVMIATYVRKSGAEDLL